MRSKFLCIRSTPTETQSISENDLECFASTGVKSPENAMFEHTNTRYPQVIARRMLLSWELQPNGKAAPLHLGCKVEDAEHLHAIRRYCIFVMDDSDVAKSKGFNQCPH